MKSLRVFVFLLFVAVVVAVPKDPKRREDFYKYVFLFASCFDCDTNMSPICGTDGFTYPNECYFNELNSYFNREVLAKQARLGYCGNDKDALIIEAMQMVKTSPDALKEALRNM